MKSSAKLDVLGLAKAIQADLYPNQSTELWTVVNIAINKKRVFTVPNDPDVPPSYGYTQNEVPSLLEGWGILESCVLNQWFISFIPEWNKYNSDPPGMISEDDPITLKAKSVGYLNPEMRTLFHKNIHNSHGLIAVLVNVKKLNEFLGLAKEENWKDELQILTVESINFDETKSQIVLNTIEVPISANTNQSELCRVLLKTSRSKKKQWLWEDILAKWGEHDFEDVKKAQRKIYEAAREINIKVSKVAHFDDFLVYNMQTVQLNPQLLK